MLTFRLDMGNTRSRFSDGIGLGVVAGEMVDTESEGEVARNVGRGGSSSAGGRGAARRDEGYLGEVRRRAGRGGGEGVRDHRGEDGGVDLRRGFWHLSLSCFVITV